jgi:hypothetical protein
MAIWPGQVVVEAPPGHGRQDEKGPGDFEAPRPRIPGEKNTARRHQGEGGPNTPAGALLEQEDGDEGGGRSFKVQQ